MRIKVELDVTLEGGDDVDDLDRDEVCDFLRDELGQLIDQNTFEITERENDDWDEDDEDDAEPEFLPDLNLDVAIIGGIDVV